MITFHRISTWDIHFLMAIRRHYTESAGAPPGKKMAWAICEDTHIIGHIGLGEPPFKLAPRRRLGLADARPLPGTVCCFIYRLEGPRESAASAILRKWHVVAEQAWTNKYGERPIHWETLIGQGAEGNWGACFKRAGYRSLGFTTGRSARRPPGHTHSARVWTDAEPKLVLYRGPLARLPHVDP